MEVEGDLECCRECAGVLGVVRIVLVPVEGGEEGKYETLWPGLAAT